MRGSFQLTINIPDRPKTSRAKRKHREASELSSKKVVLIDRLLDIYGQWVDGGTRYNPLLERRAAKLIEDLDPVLEACPKDEWGTGWLDSCREWRDKCEAKLAGQDIREPQPCMVALDFYRSLIHEDRKARICFSDAEHHLDMWGVMNAIKERVPVAKQAWANMKSEMIIE